MRHAVGQLKLVSCVFPHLSTEGTFAWPAQLSLARNRARQVDLAGWLLDSLTSPSPVTREDSGPGSRALETR